MIPLHIDHKSEFFKLYRIPNALYYKCLIKKSNIIYSYANTYFSIYSSKLIHITINSLKNIISFHFQSTLQKNLFKISLSLSLWRYLFFFNNSSFPSIYIFSSFLSIFSGFQWTFFFIFIITTNNNCWTFI